MPEGHKRMILEAVSRMSRTSPQSNKTKRIQNQSPAVLSVVRHAVYIVQDQEIEELMAFPGADLTKKLSVSIC